MRLEDTTEEERFVRLEVKCAYLEKDDETMMGYMNAAFCRLDEVSRRTLELRDLGG